ncbi:MAG: type II secretion system F family protein [Candidatus Omnitrophota bacterium]
MQRYAYVARDNYGKRVKGFMMADDEVDLANKISRLGYFLTRAKVYHGTAEAELNLARMKFRDVLNFTIHLATLVDAGLPLLDGLRDLARDAEKENIQRIVDDVRYRVESGSSLREALSYHPRSFSKLYTAIVGAGEGTGKLAPALHNLALLLEWQMDLIAKVKEAATYPIILFCVMVAVVSLLVIKVIPTFEPIFQEAGANLPMPTQVVLGVSQLVRRFWYVVLSSLFVLFVAYKFYCKSPSGRYRMDSLKLRFPLFGNLFRKVALSRFCHTLALALRSGVNVLGALDMAADVMGNSRLERSVVKARDAVNVGEKLANSLQVSGEFPALVIRMIGVGEQSGALSETLDKVCQFYDKEVPATIKRMFALFEPIMIVLMGVVVGGIALSIFLPMFQVAQLIGG